MYERPSLFERYGRIRIARIELKLGSSHRYAWVYAMTTIDRILNGDGVVTIDWNDGRRSRFHHVWLRDNCGCGDCVVGLSGERRLFTADIPDDLSLLEAGTVRRLPRPHLE